MFGWERIFLGNGVDVKKLAFIGAGNMAEALVKGIISGGICTPENIVVTDVREEQLDYFRHTFKVRGEIDNKSAVDGADVVVLAVKPQLFEEVLPDLSGTEALVISIAAGVPISRISDMLGPQARVVRVMPNTPSLLQCGAAGVSRGARATDQDVSLTLRLMQSVGIAELVEEEQLHTVTAVSGSAPAYFFYLAEAMVKTATDMGMDAELATQFTAHTMIGAGRMIEETGVEPDELRRRVTSKGGTTAEAIRVFDESGWGDIVTRAMQACDLRSRELAGD